MLLPIVQVCVKVDKPGMNYLRHALGCATTGAKSGGVVLQKFLKDTTPMEVHVQGFRGGKN